jgi:putative DNA primase/helicase
MSDQFGRHIGEVAKALRCDLNKAMSSRTELRFGNKGGLAVNIPKGTWTDWTADADGGCLDLIIHCGAARTSAEAARWMEREGFLTWEGNSPRTQPSAGDTAHREDTARTEAARAQCSKAGPLPGTVGAAYLASRGIHDVRTVAIRFSPNSPLRLRDGRKQYLPALIAEMRDVLTDKPKAVHRTFLKPDGSGKAEIGGGARRMLGPAAGCTIKLSPDDTVELGLGIAEGIETALSVLQAGWAPIWALGSAGGIERFPVLDGVEALSIFADADEAGIKAAKACQARWTQAGRECRILLPPVDGTDWNDVGCAA